MSIKEGVVRAYQHHNNAVVGIVQVSCDTDFVARNEEFLHFVDQLAMHVAYDCPDLQDDLLNQPLLTDESVTVGQFVEQQCKKFRENIALVRASRWTKDYNPDDLTDIKNVNEYNSKELKL